MPPYVYVENDRVTAPPDRIVPESGGKEMWRAGPIGPDFEHREVLPLLTRKAVAYIDEQASAYADGSRAGTLTSVSRCATVGTLVLSGLSDFLRRKPDDCKHCHI